VGGGTTDLIINAYRLEGAGTSVTLFPEQKFREGFSVAGDDILLRVVQGHVLPPIEAALRTAGIANPADLMAELVGGDRGGEDVIQRNLRQQFALQVAHPIALEFMRAAEGYDPAMGARPLRRAIQRILEDPLADFVLAQQLQPGSTILVDRKEGDEEVTMEIVPPTPDAPPADLAGAVD